MSNVNKNITVEAKLISPPTYNERKHSKITERPSLPRRNHSGIW